MRFFATVSTLYLTVASLHQATAIPLDVNDNGKLFAHRIHLHYNVWWIFANRPVSIASVRRAASTVAHGLMSYYTGNKSASATPLGFFPAPYYWWEAGAIWGAMIDYWHYTNDTSYNNVVTQALLSQISSTKDFMPPNVQSQEVECSTPESIFGHTDEDDQGNDDQAFWAFAAMSAVEKDFPYPSSTPVQWLSLAEAVFNDQVRRWDTTTCDGGLRWQIFSSNVGYGYKNSISNGAFFQLAARLARYTGNQTYVDWASKTYEWMTQVGLIGPRYLVFDGTNTDDNCAGVNRLAFSYTQGVVLYGTAVLSNYTNASALWTDRTINLLSATSLYFTPFSNASFIMFETPCEREGTCNTDQLSFKAYLSRWLAGSAQLVPQITNAVSTLLHASAKGAAASCSGGADGVTCGQRWYTGSWDDSYGVGQQLSALEVIQGLLVLPRESVVAAPPKVATSVHIVQTTATTTVPVPTVVPTTSPGDRGTSISPANKVIPWRAARAVLAILGACLL